MSKKNKDIITYELQKLYSQTIVTNIDNSLFGVQIRRRLFWTSFHVSLPILNVCIQEWKDILEEKEKVKYLQVSKKGINYINNSYNKKQLPFHLIAIENNNYWIFNKIKNSNSSSRWQASFHSDNGNNCSYYSYPFGKCRPIVSPKSTAHILIDRRFGNCEDTFIPRRFSCIEKERLFGFKDNYTLVNNISTFNRGELLANTVSILTINYILTFIDKI